MRTALVLCVEVLIKVKIVTIFSVMNEAVNYILISYLTEQNIKLIQNASEKYEV